MALRIEETFDVRAPEDLVWRWLADPQQVVHCLPGAELTEARDERTFAGKVKVKVGPVTIVYDGVATIEELDDAARRIRMRAEGKEAAGSGSARMTMTTTLERNAAGGVMVRVVADVDVVGRIVQFGRGMIESVSKQIFRQFADCVSATLEPRAAAITAETSTGATEESLTLSGAFREHPMLRDTMTGLQTPAAPYAPPRTATAVPGHRETQPVPLLPMLWRAFVDWLRARFTRSARRRD
jgi:carbon monoxide dehydrogenase subunit G